MIQEISVHLHTPTPMEPAVIALQVSSAAKGDIESPSTAPQPLRRPQMNTCMSHFTAQVQSTNFNISNPAIE